MTLRVLVVDDEASARRRMAAMLRELPDDAQLVGEAGTSDAALREIRSHRPDLVLLDIEMPGGSGLELARRLDADDGCSVVFVTAFDTHAVDAFAVAATDYLLKPVSLARLRETLHRVRGARAAAGAVRRLEDLETTASSREPRERKPPDGFWVLRPGMRQHVPLSEVFMIAAEHDHVRLHTPRGTHLLRARIGQLEADLRHADFVRIHRSVMVRRTSIRSVRQKTPGAPMVELHGGEMLSVGRKHAANVRRLFRPDADASLDRH